MILQACCSYLCVTTCSWRLDGFSRVGWLPRDRNQLKNEIRIRNQKLNSTAFKGNTTPEGRKQGRKKGRKEEATKDGEEGGRKQSSPVNFVIF